jgi:hypothetical protein
MVTMPERRSQLAHWIFPKTRALLLSDHFVLLYFFVPWLSIRKIAEIRNLTNILSNIWRRETWTLWYYSDVMK